MAKKITAPHSYDPGKGRPKEYLAYLNQREMDYLRSINGNNMERGPRGLPSFPPEDAVGSSSKAGSTKSTSSSGAGRDSSRGLGQGAGGSAVGRGPSGGGNLGGGNKGPGGPSGPNSGPSRSSSPSTGGGGKGPGGPSGPNSAPSRSPSSPMGGQGPSFSSPKSAGGYNADRAAQQRAQVNDTRSAVKNTPAARNDLAVGGIRTLSVGPMGTPVNVGPRVAPTRNTISVAGGWGVAGVGVAQRGVPNVRSPSTSGRPEGAAVRDMVAGYSAAPKKEFYDRVPTGKQFGVLGEGYDERIAPEPSTSTSISLQFPSYKYESPLTPGMTPEDMARRSAMMNQIEQEIRDINRLGAYERTGDPLVAGGVPTGGRSPGKTRGFSLSSPAEAGTLPQKENPLAGTGYGTFNMPNADRIMAAPENLPPEELRRAAETYTSPYDAPSKPAISKKEQRRLDIQNQSLGLDQGPYKEPSEKTLARLNEVFKENGLRPSGKTRGISPDDLYGPRYVEPEVQEVMKDIDKKNKQGVRGIKSIPVLGRVVEGLDLGRGLITGKKTTEADADLKRAYMQGNSAQRAELEAKYPNLTKFAQMAGEEPQLPMSNYDNWRQRSFGTGGGSGGSTSTTSQSGGTPDIGSGGKNEPIRVKQAEKETTKPKPKPKGDGRRPAIYYKWDLGVSVPSPTDSDYTLYLKYLQEKAAAKAGVA